MQVVRERPGPLSVTDETAGLMRVPINVNGHHSGAMLDVYASFSAMSNSVAAHLGIDAFWHRATSAVRLREGTRWIMDFKTMKFSLAN
jgi:predicted aspartyl protease